MSTRQYVSGNSVLNYIDRPIGLVARDLDGYSENSFLMDSNRCGLTVRYSDGSPTGIITGGDGSINTQTTIQQIMHNTDERKVGLILEEYEDGGLYVAIMGNGNIPFTYNGYKNFKKQYVRTSAQMHVPYEEEEPLNPLNERWIKKRPLNTTPVFHSNYVESNFVVNLFDGFDNWINDLMVALDYQMDFTPETGINNSPIDRPLFEGNYTSGGEGGTLIYSLSTKWEDTVKFGRGMTGDIQINPFWTPDPLEWVGGDLFSLGSEMCIRLNTLAPNSFDSWVTMQLYRVEGTHIGSWNQVAVPYNLILTHNEAQAIKYIENGTLPTDAILYPLDWDSLPTYEPNDTPDDDTDKDDDPSNDSDNDIDPNPLIDPDYSAQSMSNNNYYWLQVGQIESFINWFWNDVGELTDFDDIINKVKGLYTDLGSTVINIRYMPVNIDWIGGKGEDSNIIVGMIEKKGAVNTISKNAPKHRKIGTVTVPKNFNSFLSYTPYAQAMLWLPFYGFVDINMDLFTGRKLNLYAVYDHISGTIQYYIYVEIDGKELLLNSVVAKIAVDIPITLQSKSDRDSAIFSNVMDSVTGLIGAGATMATGTPLGIAGGLAEGAGIMTGGTMSAPISLKGTMSEQGAYYSPTKAQIITIFPVQQKGADFNKFIGKQLNKTVKLNSSTVKGGYVECANPRITFSKTVPLESEVEEIYQYLESGVIV